MPKTGIDKNLVITKTTQMVNKLGLEQITLKMLADSLDIKSPSLYNQNYLSFCDFSYRPVNYKQCSKNQEEGSENK